MDQHGQWLIGLIAAEPDLTLEETRVRLRSERKQKAGIGSTWRFFNRHDITLKKTLHAAELVGLAAERVALEAEQPNSSGESGRGRAHAQTSAHRLGALAVASGVHRVAKSAAVRASVLAEPTA
ncbi:MAG: hypothetical protein J2P53_04655 [Bradyrhizobiaceae bacterium]|nr:hypothetical protein [Bradyrhizobiaceae bacterium]